MRLVFLSIAIVSISCDRELSRYDSVRVQTAFDYNAGIDLAIDAGADIVTNVPIQRQVEAIGRVTSILWEQVDGAGEVIFTSPTQIATGMEASVDGVYQIRVTGYSVRGIAVSDELQLTWDTSPPTVPARLGASPVLPTANTSIVWFVNSSTPYLDWDDAIDAGAGVRDYDVTWYRQADCQGAAATTSGLTQSYLQISDAQDGDVFSYQVVAYDKLGQASTSECSPAISVDLASPPALNGFSAVTGPTVGTVELTAAFPVDVSDYDRVVLRRLAGTSAPANCAAGDVSATIAGIAFTGSHDVLDDTGAPGSVFSYLACVYDRAGNVTGTNVVTNRIAKLHQIFATAATYDGSIAGGGVAEADAVCQAAGEAVASLPVHKEEARWKAILSTSAIAAATRIVVNGAIEANATLVASTRALFWGGVLADSVFQTEAGAAAPTRAWTGTNADGSTAADNCSDWSSASALDEGVQGDTNATNDSWLSLNTDACNIDKSIYCISQYDVAPLAGLTATAGSGGVGRIDMTITLPTNRSRYKNLKVQRLAGSIAPGYDCGNGVTISTALATASAAISVVDANALPAGNLFSYRVCVLDASGFVVESSAITGIASSN